jgi:hypothetical protein
MITSPYGDATFSIHQTEALPRGDGVYIYFVCENLDERVGVLIEAAIAFEEMPNDKRWLWREARLKDPNGNQLILFYGGKNRKNPPWKVE